MSRLTHSLSLSLRPVISRHRFCYFIFRSESRFIIPTFVSLCSNYPKIDRRATNCFERNSNNPHIRYINTKVLFEIAPYRKCIEFRLHRIVYVYIRACKYACSVDSYRQCFVKLENVNKRIWYGRIRTIPFKNILRKYGGVVSLTRYDYYLQ